MSSLTWAAMVSSHSSKSRGHLPKVPEDADLPDSVPKQMIPISGWSALCSAWKWMSGRAGAWENSQILLRMGGKGIYSASCRNGGAEDWQLRNGDAKWILCPPIIHTHRAQEGDSGKGSVFLKIKASSPYDVRLSLRHVPQLTPQCHPDLLSITTPTKPSSLFFLLLHSLELAGGSLSPASAGSWASLYGLHPSSHNIPVSVLPEPRIRTHTLTYPAPAVLQRQHSEPCEPPSHFQAGCSWRSKASLPTITLFELHMESGMHLGL